MVKIIEKIILWIDRYIEIDPIERVVASNTRAGCRIVLELIRNMLVVGAVLYLAQKTKSPILYAVAFTGMGALVGYCVAFTYGWSIRLPLFTKRSWVYASVSATLYVLIAMGSFAAILFILYSTVAELTKAQVP